jgi:hypothetical protein
MSIELTACRFADTRQRLKIGHLIQDMHTGSTVPPGGLSGSFTMTG